MQSDIVVKKNSLFLGGLNLFKSIIETVFLFLATFSRSYGRNSSL
ncbi:hypothetical protein LEP1GSC062_0747 [Leptospira alexanderi serovar Manhao 3 str. L 60]|uniref:Uncharacterized protein n=1 Tax=Leptospira alexanderi serovar Manhao 3 str. L 60 TaxID=1049759 RepID=V6I917_9LEPT|nr:hypothetical protein LEP1GSC062_0747 [Leptospira alexanderi serovar Manhao 3 str. L 60]